VFAVAAKDTDNMTTYISGVAWPYAELSAVISPDNVTVTGTADADGAFRIPVGTTLTPGEKSVALTGQIAGEKKSFALSFTVETGKTSPLIPVAVVVGIGILGGGALFFYKKRTTPQAPQI
jgi:LPXTG-motif cell wall-anchored protein